MGGYLPDELVFEILSRLPSKSLLRFRCVCTSWYSLISSPVFKSAHFQNFNKLHPRSLVRRFELIKNKETYTVHLNDKALTMDPETIIEFPFNCEGCNINYFRIIGVCNGVICLCHDESISEEDKIILWNPSIGRKLIMFPPTINLRPFVFICAFGFGYDEMAGDYKVVRVAYNRIVFSKPQVDVYTVKTAIWREVTFPDNFPCMYLGGSQVLLKGCLHWIAYESWSGVVSNCSIIKFDLSTELFEEIQLPGFIFSETPMSLEISVVEEMLAVILSRRIHPLRGSGSTYVIWVMKEYKNPSSWTLIYNVCYDIDMGRVLRLRNNGDIIMGSRYGNLMIRNNNVGYYDASCMGFITDKSIYIDRYKESLALLDVGHDVLIKDVEEEEEYEE